ncbi:MAG5620 family putative phospho-sugar mutase [Mycoplasma sp. Mirounga ES2805-ORL]|uniref:MAG5620 family putative phospho-sugar mutase n=1 Tax=Mycoplasma sp. Mirounga ES2805-ORL TaxID=754514 RepID=UPI00197B6EAD|nr:hypothetical protein [Mycoplasma sp. Mirounga ES2805-ORL]QSF13733.1 hypothetical protein JXZ90_00315 [Mycoplasma sp. Mirounga ES2805-ORL]
MDKEVVLNTKNNLIVLPRSIMLDSVDAKKDISFSLSILAQSISKVIEPVEKILVSFQGDIIDEKYKLILFSALSKKGKIYEYSYYESIPLVVDEYLLKKEKYNTLLKIVYDKNNFLEISIFDSNMMLKKELFENVKEEYLSLNEYTVPTSLETEKINLSEYIKELASTDEMLKAFKNLRHKYKTSSLFKIDDSIGNVLMKEAINNSKNNALFYKKNKFKNPLNIKLLTKIFKTHFSNNLKVSNLFLIDKFDNINLSFLIDNKYKWLNSNELAALYLDFLLEELKRNKVDISGSFVILPQNAPLGLFELLKSYKIKQIFYDDNNFDEMIRKENCIFAYTDKSFYPNPIYSKVVNNYYFIFTIIWMLNAYKNRNNILTYKYKNHNEIFGKIITKHVNQKFNKSNLDLLIKYISNNYKNIKYSQFDLINVYKTWNNNKLVLLKLISNNKHQLIISFDPKNNQLHFEYQLCKEYQNTISNNVFISYIKQRFFIFKLMKGFKRFKNKVNEDIKENEKK